MPTQPTPTPNVSSTSRAPSTLSRLPRFISHFLGYRAEKPAVPGQPIISFWSFIGAFCGLSVIQAVFGYSAYFLKRGTPLIVPSYGASAVLIYGAIDAPLAQPQALLGGHFVGALTGIIITKLFLLLPTEAQFNNVLWLVVSLSCAAAIVAMQLTKTVHPPAGATAILPALDSSIRDLGWYYLPVVLLSSSLALIVALLVNNIQRRYPTVWITPLVLPSMPNLTKIRKPATVTKEGLPGGDDRGTLNGSEHANGMKGSETAV